MGLFLAIALQVRGDGASLLWPVDLPLAGLFIVIILGWFMLGSAVIHRLHRRDVTLIENQLLAIQAVEERLEQRTQELERSNNDLVQFAYVASHDLRAPVRAIKSFSQILEKDYREKLDEEANECLDFIVTGASRLETLINDLLAYSRVDTQGKAFVPVDTSEVLDQVVGDLRLDIEESQAEITRDALPVVVADASQMTQLFQNLISNAIKFQGQDPPKVHVAVRKEDDGWVFSVKDNGIGIEAEHTERIFAMFQRLHTQDEYPGNGMGSAICKKIVERHGGNIWVQSKVGMGSTFYFSIPSQGENVA